ncbi:galactokinase [Neophaeococcomyces mojaviensis]|uniref:Galactokinase n=1 Tax=Neophaeococcomyces mojaviensis TaxID=3383035 RepID=A0ACC3A3T6_9EURO|nr:galactokinase [Knufia sp. JES_112]
MTKAVPRVTSFDDVYTNVEGGALPEQKARLHKLVESFTKKYGEKPDFIARSPGRVNIIGEHIDYSLYNVLPAAVTVDVLVAVKVNEVAKETTISVANTNDTKYPTAEFHVPQEGDVHIGEHDWSNYFKAGLKGSIQVLRKQHGDDFQPKSMDVMIDGNVPAGGGLSSSAAFVCASALAVMAANDYDVSKQDLLDLCIVSERSVGVYSGGMDQAASIFSEKGYLLYCRFFPEFSAEHVPVPAADPEVTFLIAQSFITSDKALTAARHYNLRVVEVTLAAVLLAKLFDITLNKDQSSLGFSIRNFQEELMKKLGNRDLGEDKQLDMMIDVVQEKLTQQSYNRQQVADILEISVKSLEEAYFSKFDVEGDTFKLRQRALHVVEEARRVVAFKDTLSSNAGKKLTSDQLTYLGDLMNKTQDSCRDVYECSCPEIDEICTIARKAGTLGSRLTGAGWGGCTVHLVPQNKVEAVIEALKKEYYNKTFLDLPKEKMQDAIVISRPGQGSSLITGEAINV